MGQVQSPLVKKISTFQKEIYSRTVSHHQLEACVKTAVLQMNTQMLAHEFLGCISNQIYMADNPNKKKKDSKQVSQQEHEQKYQERKASNKSSGSKSGGSKASGRSSDSNGRGK